MSLRRLLAVAAATLAVAGVLLSCGAHAQAQAQCDPLSPTLATTLVTEITNAVVACVSGDCTTSCRAALTSFTSSQCVVASCGTFSGACTALAGPLALCGMTMPPFTACSFEDFRLAMDNVTAQCLGLFGGGSNACTGGCQSAVNALLSNECSRRFCVGACQTSLENAQSIGCSAVRALQSINETLVQAGGQVYRFFNQSGGTLQLNVTGLADVALDIPANALPDSAATSSVALSLLRSTFQLGVSLASAGVGAQFAGPSVAFTPHGLAFSTPVTIRVPFLSSTVVPAGMRLCVTVAASDTSTTATLVPGCGTVNTTGGFVSVSVSSFSVYSAALVPSSSPTSAAGAASATATAILLAAVGAAFGLLP